MTHTDIIAGVSGPLSDPSVRHKIEALESEFLKLPQVEIPVTHRYAGGIYAREIVIPKDTILTGRIYKEDHFDIMVSGDISVSSEDGLKRLQGFHILEGKRGKKRAGFTREETKWITLCACPELSDDEYIDYITVTSFNKLLPSDLIDESEIMKAFRSQQSYDRSDYKGFKLGYLMASGKRLKSDADHHDYNQMLIEYGVTEEFVRLQSEATDDMIMKGFYHRVRLGLSNIEGRGLFAKRDISENTVIIAAGIQGKRTIAGRYTNHSVIPNAIMKLKTGNDVDLVSTREIKINEEITIDYRDSLNMRIKKVS